MPRILYQLTDEDVYSVADELGISREKITDEVLRSIEKVYETIPWHETTEDYLREFFNL